MKKYEFSLKRVKEFKETILNREKSVLLSLSSELRLQEEKRDQLKEELLQIGEVISQSTQSGISASMLNLYDGRRKGIRQELETLDTKISLLIASVERQKKRVAQAKQDVSGMEKLEEKQLEEYRELEKKENDLIIEEFISSKMAREQNG